ncbi:hypothetical protein KVC75_05640 [Helicobacter pylori]|nr:hypothetical protein KVC75_05640 [Helicobacter pylori]
MKREYKEVSMEESKKRTTLNRFPCTSCGLCCKNITGIIELIGFDAGNGVCKFLDLETNLCKIYIAGWQSF